MQSTDASFRNIKPNIYGENQEILNHAVINQCFLIGIQREHTILNLGVIV